MEDTSIEEVAETIDTDLVVVAPIDIALVTETITDEVVAILAPHLLTMTVVVVVILALLVLLPEVIAVALHPEILLLAGIIAVLPHHHHEINLFL